MCMSSVPFGSTIPVAQSIPVLVPRQSLTQSSAACQHKNATTHPVSPVQQEDLDVETWDTNQTACQMTVGLYDDPDAGDDLHNNPLLHTTREVNEDSEPAMETCGLGVPANPQHCQFHVPTPLEYEAPPGAARLHCDSHTEWFACLILLLIAVLHAKHQVSFHACTLILFMLNTILLALNLLQPTDPLPVTLHTIINRFDLQDRFTIYPICSSCHWIFPIDAPIDTLCSNCDSHLFKPISDRLF
jgi:hypothetical protein